MKERPILFSAPMILALLAGLKTQTRRIFKDAKRKDGAKLLPELLRSIGIGAACPYGEPGDRLWVRETMWTNGGYVATDPAPHPNAGKRPSIFMRRGDSRLTFELTGVRLERLQEISEADAIAEGISEGYIPADEDGPPRVGYMFGPDDGRSRLWPTARAAYLEGWDSINGKGSASKNPWVWVLEFPPVPR